MRIIHAGKKYMMLHGDGEGPKHAKPPVATGIDISHPVIVLRRSPISRGNKPRWMVRYTCTCRGTSVGFVSNHSFGEEVKTSNIEVGKKYMMLQGDDEGPDYVRSPTTRDIDLSVPVTVLREHQNHNDGETCWSITYTDTGGSVVDGYACDRSFGGEVK